MQTFFSASIGGIIVLANVVFAFPVFAGSFSVTPSALSVTKGQSVCVSVIVSTDTSANAVGATLLYPSALLKLTLVSTNKSVVSFWPKPPSVANPSFAGVISNGYSGSSGTIATYTFIAKETGVATITLQSPELLANDGQGTMLPISTRSAKVIVKAKKSETSSPVILPPSSISHPIIPLNEIPLPSSTNSIVTVQTPTPALPSQPLEPPLITQIASVLPPNQYLAVKGKASTSSTIWLWIQNALGQQTKISDRTRDDGSFFLTFPEPLQEGDYLVWGNVARGNDRSDSSILHSVSVKKPFFATFDGWFISNEKHFLLSLLIFLVCLVVFLAIRIYKIRK